MALKGSVSPPKISSPVLQPLLHHVWSSASSPPRLKQEIFLNVVYRPRRETRVAGLIGGRWFTAFYLFIYLWLFSVAATRRHFCLNSCPESLIWVQVNWSLSLLLARDRFTLMSSTLIPRLLLRGAALLVFISLFFSLFIAIFKPGDSSKDRSFHQGFYFAAPATTVVFRDGACWRLRLRQT